MAGVRKLRPAYAASGERILPKAEGPSKLLSAPDEAAGMSWSWSQRHWRSRAAARNRVSITQNAPWSLRIFSGTRGVRAIWMKAGLPSFSRGECLARCPVVATVALVGAAGVVSVMRAVTSEEFGPGATATEVWGTVASETVGSDEGVGLLKAVSLGCVCAFEAQARFSVR